jgi:opacity protein-like surface antigen
MLKRKGPLGCLPQRPFLFGLVSGLLHACHSPWIFKGVQQLWGSALVFVIVISSVNLQPSIARAAESMDVYVGAYILTSWPHDNRIFNQGTSPEASIKQGLGAGLKVGLFPSFTKRMLGVELDSYGHGSALSFPNTANGQSNGVGRSDLLVQNTMVNVVLRYPGEIVTPYLGVGVGWSTGLLFNLDIVGRRDKDFDSAQAFGHQYLAGVQAMVSEKIFLFGEYRYFSANYHWDGFAVDFRTHHGIVGVGMRF